jgi:transposase
MEMEQLFGMVLGIASPWKITGVKFSQSEGEFRGLVEISIDFDRGGRFLDGLGVSCAVHDTVKRSWQHIDFFQHKCLLYARVPRIRTSGGDVHTVEVPWARPGSSFTLHFEAFGMLMIRNGMPVSSVAEVLGIYDNRVWRFFNHWVGVAKERQNLSTVKPAGVDMNTRKVTEMVEGKGATQVAGIDKKMAGKGGYSDKMRDVSMDMSPSLISSLDTCVTEDIHNKIELAKRRAKGYRNPQNFQNMIHFIAGDLIFDHPLFRT